MNDHGKNSHGMWPAHSAPHEAQQPSQSTQRNRLGSKSRYIDLASQRKSEHWINVQDPGNATFSEINEKNSCRKLIKSSQNCHLHAVVESVVTVDLVVLKFICIGCQ